MGFAPASGTDAILVDLGLGLGHFGLVGHHFEKGRTGPGRLIGLRRRRHRVQQPGREHAIKSGEAGIKRVVLTRVPISQRGAEVHDWRATARRESDPER